MECVTNNESDVQLLRKYYRVVIFSRYVAALELTESCLYVQGQNGLDGMIGIKGPKGELGPKV